MLRRSITLLAAAITALAAFSPAMAEEPGVGLAQSGKAVTASPTGSYIVVMRDQPLLASFGQDGLRTSAAGAAAAADEAAQRDVLRAAGVSTSDQTQSYTNALNGFAAALSLAEAEAIAADPRVALVLPDEMRQVTTDASPKFLGLSGPGEAWATGLTGEDVIVGVIDTGIWPEHPSFADDGSYSDLGLALDESVYDSCDFGNTTHHPDDAAFDCNNKLVGARQVLGTYRFFIGAEADEFDSARDDDGHGTHTASTAAGNAGVDAHIFGQDLGTVSGIAPRARVIAYKALGNLGGFTSDLVEAIDQAVADGVDVINYSVGGGAGLTTGDAISFLFAADAGVLVATSAGNSGPGAATIGGPADVPWITTVGANTQPRFFKGSVALGLKPNGRTYSGASITLGTDKLPLVDAANAGGDLCLPGTLDPAQVAGKIVLCRRGAIGRVAKGEAVYLAGGAGMIMYNNSDTDNLFTDTHFVPSVHVDYTQGLQIKHYITTTTNPLAKISTGAVGTWTPTPSMTIFSSRGPNPSAADIIKPDITAPGMQILAGASPFPGPGAVSGELFQAIAGTSMSSPHVAGMFALLKQAHPDWSAAMAKSAIMTTANPSVIDNDRSSSASPFAMGSGHLTPGKVNSAGSAFNPGLVYDAGLFEYAAFMCGATPGFWTQGTCDFLAGLGLPFDASDLNYASIGIAELAGSQVVTRTVTSVANRSIRYTASVEAPPGYTVSVSPSTITLKPGQSASFEVTITNRNGRVGEWRFGSMTWKGSGYSARSPIAVNASQFNAPALVQGVGESGSSSFGVTFGYTGAYTAAAHGLVADNPLVGSVSQDPDQTYPSGDDGVGVVKHTFSVAGAAYMRFELVLPGAPDDIDLFLEDSSGNIIAGSTSGGTDELIEVVLPADDTYTLVVHGWSVPNQPLAYAVSYWEVPLASGGSLVVDSAPASATLGAVETVSISWAGAAAGRSFGAVSHSDASGLFGITLVEVTN